MPGIGGPAFVAELHNRVPSVPVLVLGDAGETQADYEGGYVRFLSRPVASDDMLDTADQMLSGNGSKSNGVSANGSKSNGNNGNGSNTNEPAEIPVDASVPRS